MQIAKGDDGVRPGADEVPRLEAQTALPLGVHAVAEARHFVLDHLRRWEIDDDVAAAVTLVVSELVTNAVLYGHGAATLALAADPDVVRVEVSDRSTVAPQARQPHDDSEIGRGLHIIEAVSVDWGVRPTDDGKVVWCTLAAQSVPPIALDLVQERL